MRACARQWVRVHLTKMMNINDDDDDDKDKMIMSIMMMMMVRSIVGVLT